MNYLKKLFLKKIISEKGQGATEYGLIIVLVIVFILSIMTWLGPTYKNFLGNVIDNPDQGVREATISAAMYK